MNADFASLAHASSDQTVVTSEGRDRRVDAVAGILVLLMLIVRLWQVPTPVSGLDPGNWLAFAESLFGPSIKASHETMYPPMIPIFLRTVLLVADPMSALRVVATVSSLLPGIAAYLILRYSGRTWCSLFGIAFSEAGYSSEMLAWGGYPQLLATGFLLLALAFLVRAMNSRRLVWFVASGIAAGCCFLTSQLIAIQVTVAFGVCYFLWGMTDRPGWKSWLRSGLALAVATLLTLSFSLPVYLNFLRFSGEGAFNVQGFHELLPQVIYIIADTPSLWAILVVLIVPSWVLLVRRREWSMLSILTGLLVASLGLAALTKEVRFLHVLEATGFIGLAVLVYQLYFGRKYLRLLDACVIIAAIALALTIAVAGAFRYVRAVYYYQALDPAFETGLVWLRAHHQPGDLASSTTTGDRWPLGWWVEGLGETPTLIETNPRWVAFSEEKTHAAIAEQIFRAPTLDRAARIARRYGVTLLVIDTRDASRSALWQSDGNGTTIVAIFRNPSVVIYRIAPPNPSGVPIIPQKLLPSDPTSLQTSR